MWLIEDIDIYLFYAINKGMKSSFLDFLMPFVTNYRNWYFIAITGMLIIIIKDWKRGVTAIILAVVVVSISDYLNSHIIKSLFGRVRPCRELPIETMYLIIGCPHNPSFPSSHASNIFALSVVLVYRYRTLLAVMLIYAFLVCLSRVYLGVHYPFDVIAGGVSGIFYGSAVIFTYKQVIKKYEKTKSIKG